MSDIQKRGLDSNAVKLIAIAAMTIDHIAWALWPGYPHELLPLLMHLIGRVTCPVMCFFIAEGYHYTRDVNKYTFRLFAFALVSHFCYIFFLTQSRNIFINFIAKCFKVITYIFKYVK